MARAERIASVLALGILASACSGGTGSGSAAPDSIATSSPGSTGSVPPPTELGPTAAELPEPRTEVVGVVWRGLVAVAGGLTPDGAGSRRFDVWDPATDRWSPGPDLPIPLHHAGMATLGERVYVVGGFSNEAGGEWLSQARAFSLGPGDEAWRDEPSMGRPRGALALAATAERLVAIGGVAEGTLTARVESWAPGEGAWQVEPGLATAREHLAAAVALDGRVYAIAGRQGGIDTNLASVESWAPGDAEWRAEPPVGHPRGGIGAAAFDDGLLCVAGGEEPAGTIAPVECLDVASGEGTWTVVGELSVPRHGLAVVALAGRLHVVGGGPDPGLFVSGAHEILTVA